ncbi:hypothetical protein M0R89_01590 [Halorussus limi]|uniref:DUF7096 domain-containing protein n=1 Tax=Halorussus limi TaxID=2938695 RepID=A0A8U0HVA0_9EURY|nr:hypothetical protein [Halorussus limi]UPV74779.1 hypothetical protein M0R89_01590 [Halorussus limi]
MKPTFVLLFAAVGLACVTGAAVADADHSARPATDAEHPDWPGGETTNQSDDADDSANDGTPDGDATTGLSPGQQLTGAVGAQGASVQGELLNRSLSARLSNATTPAERAEVIADETESMAAYLDGLEGVRENLTESWETDELSEGEYRAALTEFVVRARTVERRANRTARAAENLSESTRRIYGVNTTRIWNLSERAHALYQFENAIGREVVNETLDNGSDRRRFPIADDRSV